MESTKQSQPDSSFQRTEAYPHIFEQIFKFLDFKSLLSAMTVCKSWKNLISSSPNLMQQVHLVIDLSKREKLEFLDEISDSDRRFNSVILEHVDAVEEYEAVKTIIESHQWRSMILHSQFSIVNFDPWCISKLSVLEITTLNLSFVSDVIKASPGLKCLKIVTAFSEQSDFEKLDDCCLQKLEKLKIAIGPFATYNGRAVFPFLKNHRSLRELELHGVIMDSRLANFISELKNLKLLGLLHCKNDSSLRGADLLEMKNLKVLKFFRKRLDEDRFFSLLLSATTKIRKLEVLELSGRVVELILNNQQQLKEIHAELLTYRNLIFEEETFPSLEKIKIKSALSKYQQENILKHVMENLSNFTLCLFEEMIRAPHKNVKNINVGLYIPEIN